MGLAMHCARGPQVVANCMPERFQTEWIHVVDRVHLRLPAVVRHQP